MILIGLESKVYLKKHLKLQHSGWISEETKKRREALPIELGEIQNGM